jgi:hypothetical protein
MAVQGDTGPGSAVGMAIAPLLSSRLGDQELGQSLPNDSAPANLSAGVGTVRSRCAAAAIEEIGR